MIKKNIRKVTKLPSKKTSLDEKKKLVTEMNKLKSDMKSIILNKVTNDFEVSEMMSKNVRNYYGTTEEERDDTKKLLNDYYNAPNDKKEFYFKRLPANIQFEIQKSGVRSVPIVTELMQKLPDPKKSIDKLKDDVKDLTNQVKKYNDDLIDNHIKPSHIGIMNNIDLLRGGDPTANNIKAVYEQLALQINDLQTQINTNPAAPGNIGVELANLTALFNNLTQEIQDLNVQVVENGKANVEFRQVFTKVLNRIEIRTVFNPGRIDPIDGDSIYTIDYKGNRNVNDMYYFKYKPAVRGTIEVYKLTNPNNLIISKPTTVGLLKLLVNETVTDAEVTLNDKKNYYLILRDIGFPFHNYIVRNTNKMHLIMPIYNSPAQFGLGIQTKSLNKKKKKIGTGIKIFTSKKEIEHRLKLLQGSVLAGNNSIEVKNEIKTLKNLLSKSKK